MTPMVYHAAEMAPFDPCWREGEGASRAANRATGEWGPPQAKVGVVITARGGGGGASLPVGPS